jgi:hypothetical protein
VIIENETPRGSKSNQTFILSCRQDLNPIPKLLIICSYWLKGAFDDGM